MTLGLPPFPSPLPMSESVAILIVIALGIHLGLGLLWSIPFVLKGVGKVDPDAREGSWGFRLLILPGCMALWPLLWMRLRNGGPPEERSPHRDAARRGEAA